MTKKCATNDVVRRHLAIFHVTVRLTVFGFLLKIKSLLVEGGELHGAGPRKGFY